MDVFTRISWKKILENIKDIRTRTSFATLIVPIELSSKKVELIVANEVFLQQVNSKINHLKIAVAKTYLRNVPIEIKSATKTGNR